jgi:hypothetical protein
MENPNPERSCSTVTNSSWKKKCKKNKKKIEDAHGA